MLRAILVSLFLILPSQVVSFFPGKNSLGIRRSLIFERYAESDSPKKLENSKGFGAPKAKPIVEEAPKDTGTVTYELQSKRGVPEYSIFLRPSNGSETEWLPVGSMTIPRDTKPSKAIFDVEQELLSGAFKLYPKLRAYYDVRIDKSDVFEYGYCPKAFPDEEIKVALKSANTEQSNFFMNWIGKLTNPIDNSSLKNKGTMTIKQ